MSDVDQFSCSHSQNMCRRLSSEEARESIITNEISRREYRVTQVTAPITPINNLPTPSISRFVTVAAFIGYIKFKFHQMGHRCNYKDLPQRVPKSALVTDKGQLIHSVIKQISCPNHESFDLDDIYVMHNKVQLYLQTIDQQRPGDNSVVSQTANAASRAASASNAEPVPSVKKSIVKKKSCALAAAKVAASSANVGDENVVRGCKIDPITSRGSEREPLQKQYRHRPQAPPPATQQQLQSTASTNSANAEATKIKHINDVFMKTLVGRNRGMVLECEVDCSDCARLKFYQCEWRCIKCVYISLINIVAVFHDMFDIPCLSNIIYEFRNTLDCVYLLRSHASNTVYSWLNSRDFYYQLVPNMIAYDANIKIQPIPLNLTHLLKSFIHMFDVIFEEWQLSILVEYSRVSTTRAQIEQSIACVFYTALGEVTMYIKSLGYLSKEADMSAHTKSLHVIRGDDTNSQLLPPYASIADSQSERIKLLDIERIIQRCCVARLTSVIGYYYQPKGGRLNNSADWRALLRNRLVAVISTFFVSIVDIFDSNANSTNQMLALYDNGNNSIRENYKVVVNIYSILAGLNSVAEHYAAILEARACAEDLICQNISNIDSLLGADYSMFRVDSEAVSEIQLFINSITAPSAAESGMSTEHRFNLARNFSEVIQKQKMWYLKSVHIQTLANINICLESYLINRLAVPTPNAVSIIFYTK